MPPFAALRVILVFTLLAVTALPFLAAATSAGQQETAAEREKTAPGAFQATKTQHSYANVKEDLLCRACVALSSDYFERVLPSIRARYDAYVTGQTSSGSYRERMIAELHEAVDGLCAALKTRHTAQHDAEADGHSAPLSGSTKDLDEAIDIACPSSMEALDDALTEIAFAFLLPDKFPSHTEGDADTKSSDRQDADAAPYVLPKAGAFCEAHKQCLPFIHYHITSIAGRAGKNTSLTQAERDAMEAKLDVERERQQHADRPEAIPGGRDEDNDEPSLVERLTDPETYKKLPERVPVDTVLSTTFWKWVLHYMFVDEAVRFHLTERMTFVIGTALALFAVFAASVCLCMRKAKPSGRKGVSSGAHATGLNAAGTSSAPEVRKTSVSSTRRRAPARKEV